MKWGGHEFARQYEWSTCKSQPNCLKREGADHDPGKGLTAVDFRAGLALLPFAPMSPGDFKLIFQGLGRGSLVQFDRGCLKTLETFIHENKDGFTGMDGMLDDLKKSEDIYRNSIPDLTHNHFRLLFSRKLWSTMLRNAVTGWRIRNIVDDKTEQTLKKSRFKTILFFLIGLFPFAGSFIRRLLARADWRKHYSKMLSSWGYLKKSIKARIAEKIIGWHRDERIDEQKALQTAESFPRFLFHLPFSIIPFAGLHKLMTDFNYLKDRLDYYLLRPIRLYFKADLREEWLREMVDEGIENHIISKEDADIILSQLNEPFIQKYLKCLAVHVCTLPVTQVVALIVAAVVILMNPGMKFGEASAITAGIFFLFQVTPISPGSMVRGGYVTWLVIRERNFKDYNIAIFLAFFKYIGYLAFPIQMAYRYPVLARFMAGHWASESVHIVPVFGEAGALLERWVYCLFYNWPLTIRRRVMERIEKRAPMKNRYWQILPYASISALLFGITDYLYLQKSTQLPGLWDIWWIVPVIPMITGALVTMSGGGTGLAKRIISAVAAGIISGCFYTVISGYLVYHTDFVISSLMSACVWRVFVFTVFSVIGAILAEIFIPDPELKNAAG